MSEGQLTKDAWERGRTSSCGLATSLGTGYTRGTWANARTVSVVRVRPEAAGLRDTARHLGHTLREGGSPRTARTRVS